MAAALVVVAGCSAHRGFRQAQIAEQFERWDEAVVHYLELVERHPDRVQYRTALLRAKIRASQEHFKRAKEYQEVGALDQALVEYRQAVQLDPTNQYAQVEYEKLRDEMQARRRQGGDIATLDEMKRRTEGRRPQPPLLSPRSTTPISLEFPKPVSVFDIYRSLGKAFGINVLFDPKLRDQKISIELREVYAQDALEILMRTANHFYKVLDEKSIIVAEDNPQNRRNYEDLVIQTFFLSNAEVKDVMTMLRSLVGAKNVAANDQLNAIVLRDTADKVKVAERIIRTNDKSRGEVVIDVELLQINTSKLQELGISLSEYSVTQSLDPNPIRASDVEFINQGNWILNLPAIIYSFVKNSAEAQLLASPQLRISDGEAATLHIGDREPIPVTTFNTSQTIGGNIVPVTSFQYQDVGIRLDLKPRIHHNQEISLELTVEVSQISGFREASGGQRQPIIGTRTIESTIRLQDGETNFLAGLIRTDEQNTSTGFPGLSDIPVLGRLFSNKRTDRTRTDLVLTLTPHIVRTPDITEEDLLPIWVGTEANITFRGGSPRVESDVEGPFEEEAGSDESAERIRDMIRRRIQNLPRGLRDAADEEEADEPEGIELVPSAAPRDVFGRPREEPDDVEDEPPLLWWVPEEGERGPAARDEGPGARREETGGEAAGAEGEKTAARAAPPVQVNMLPGSFRAPEGTTFEIQIEVVTNKRVNHLPLAIVFDPEVLSVEEVREGNLFLNEESELLADFSTPGKLVIGSSILGKSKGVKGRGIVAIVTFKAEAEGRARIQFERAAALDRNLKKFKQFEANKSNVQVVAAPAGGGSS